jgi:hypothetical protein
MEGWLPGDQGATVNACMLTTCWGIASNQPEVETDPPWGLLDESADGGETWSALPAPNDVTGLNDLAIAPNGSIIIVGSNVTNGTVIEVVTP